MKLKIAIAAIGLALFTSSCSGVKHASNNSSTYLNTYTDGELSYKSQFRFKYLFLESQRLKSLEDFEEASALIEQCLAIDPQNADAHYEMAQLSIRLEQIEKAVFHAEQSKELNSTNVWVHQLLAQLYQVQGDTEKELKAFEALVDLEPSSTEYQYHLALAYSRTNQYKKALQVYNKLERAQGINEELSVKKEHLYIVMGDLDAAVLELRKLINAYPLEIRYRGMLAELYQANDLEEEAVQVYREILSIDVSEPRANMALAEHYRLNNQFLKAFEYLDYSFTDSSFDVDVKFQILVTYFQLALEDEKYIAALNSLIEKAIETHPNQASFYAILGDVHFNNNESEKAFNSYEQALNLGANEFLIWNRYLILGLELRKYETVQAKGLKAIELHPIQPTLYLFTGIAGTQITNEEPAVAMLKKGLNYVVNNRPLKAEFFNYLAEAYHKLEEHELSDTYYEKSLALIPENPIVLNNYSYYLSLRSENLEKAESLAKQANDLSPNESTYQDTYGWILYKLGRYTEAVDWLLRALNNGGDESGVILEHYGDALYKMNRVAEAKEYWMKAVKAGGASDFIDQKVSQGILYE
jgi:tetratricopeptide (TPR) repeat protein